MVKLTELDLIQFGRFSEYKIDLRDGLNLIYGVNETGKSTIQLFIKSMLYGIPSRGGKSRGLKDRDRVIPWGETRAIGRLKLVKDGTGLEVYREFRKRPSGDVTRVTLSATGEDYFDKEVSGEELGMRLLGMSRSMFERTVWIAQNDIGATGQDDEITAKLINLIESGGSSDVSVSNSLKYLDKEAAALKAKTGRNTPGAIDRLRDEKERLRETLAEARARAAREEQNRRRAKALESRIEELDRKKAHLAALEESEIAKEKISRVERLDSCLAKEMQIGNTRQFQLFRHKATEETVSQIRNSAEAIDTLELKAYQKQQELNENNRLLGEKDKRKRNMGILVGVLVLLAIASVGAGALLHFSVMPLFIGVWAILGAFIAGGIICYCKVGGNIVELKSGRELLIKDADLLRRELEEAEGRLKSALDSLECRTVKEFEEKYGLYSEDKAKIKVVRDLYEKLLGEDSYEELKREAEEKRSSVLKEPAPSGVDLRREINRTSEERDRAFGEAAALKASLSEERDSVSEADISDSIKAIDEELLKKGEELEAYQMARECLSAAYTKIKSDYTPLLNKKTEEILNGITGGSHSGIRIGEDFTASLKNAGDLTDVKPAEFFSVGTYNQIYLAIRLAVAELTLNKENTVLFLDDALMSFDDQRAKNTIELLKDMCGDGRQALLFTCHSRDKNISKKFDEINFMEVTV